MGAEPLLKEEVSVKKYKDPTDVLDEYYTEELIIALCGQLGTNLSNISKELKDILEEDYDYECEEKKLSQYLFEGNKSTPTDEFDRVKEGMDLGDNIRKKKGYNYLASRAISDILHSRTVDTPNEDFERQDFKSRRKCFIINSLKHPKELEALSKVYGVSFYLLGVFSSEKDRKDNLKKRFAKKHHSKIEDLISRDDNSEVDNGQKLRKVFVQSDYFIRDSHTNDKLKDKLARFIDLIFDFGVNTPSIDENAMYQATAAAANSSCLSRQVGACITDENGHILSLGWNDVPCFEGGVYPSSDKIGRCLNWKKCTNTERKNQIINNIIKDMEDANLIKKASSKKKFISKDSTPQSLVRSILEKRGIKDLIEFGRSVHAEMYAIIEGSQRTGDKMVKGKLFCTTYPCHNCARHIIMAGIKEVYYIEPYTKSLCLVLHKDSITEDEDDNSKVRILMYEGVAPKSFIKFYQLISDDRKEKVNGQDKKKLKPKYRGHLEALFEKETHYYLSLVTE